RSSRATAVIVLGLEVNTNNSLSTSPPRNVATGVLAGDGIPPLTHGSLRQWPSYAKPLWWGSLRRSTRHPHKLELLRPASGCWPDSTGGPHRPTGFLRKVSSMFLTSLSSFPGLPLAQARGGPPRRGTLANGMATSACY